MKTSRMLIPATLLLSACVGRSTSDEASAPAKPWKDQDHDERMLTMKNVVHPAMKAEFVKWDPKEFSGMTCATCHGPGAKDKTFKMPNPKLPKLPATEAEFEKLKEENPCAVHFMMEIVVPRMADFVGEKPFDPKTHEGFSCFRCHPKDVAAGN